MPNHSDYIKQVKMWQFRCPFCKGNFIEKTFEQITETANEHYNSCLNNPNKKLCQSCVNYTPNNYFKKCKIDVGSCVIMRKQCNGEPCELWKCKKSLIKHIDEGDKNA